MTHSTPCPAARTAWRARPAAVATTPARLPMAAGPYGTTPPGVGGSVHFAPRWARWHELDAVPVLPRSAWGADEDRRFADGEERWPPTYATAEALVVHHTRTVNEDPSPAATMRAIYRFHADVRGWGDIGYHCVVAPDGRVFAGRADGGRPGVVAGHALGHNTGTEGIAVLGNFEEALPTPEAWRSLVALLAAPVPGARPRPPRPQRPARPGRRPSHLPDHPRPRGLPPHHLPGRTAGRRPAAAARRRGGRARRGSGRSGQPPDEQERQPAEGGPHRVGQHRVGGVGHDGRLGHGRLVALGHLQPGGARR